MITEKQYEPERIMKRLQSKECGYAITELQTLLTDTPELASELAFDQIVRERLDRRFIFTWANFRLEQRAVRVRNAALMALPVFLAANPRLASDTALQSVIARLDYDAHYYSHPLFLSSSEQAISALLCANPRLSNDTTIGLVMGRLTHRQGKVRRLALSMLKLFVLACSKLAIESRFEIVKSRLEDRDTYVRMAALDLLLIFFHANRQLATPSTIQQLIDRSETILLHSYFNWNVISEYARAYDLQLTVERLTQALHKLLQERQEPA